VNGPLFVSHDVSPSPVTVIGMTLDQVQDFYAHSNWADKHWGGDATWFDVPDAFDVAYRMVTTGG
jgi:hypothetical protein